MTAKRRKARASVIGLLSTTDQIAVKERFGALPGTSAVTLLIPSPAQVDSNGRADVQSHTFWYETWKALRRKGLGASELACVAGIPGAYGSPFALWWNKKVGLEVEDETDEILVMGTKLESVIGSVWAERNPQAMLLRPGSGLYRHPTIPWLMATPDFLAVQAGDDGDPWPSVEPVECKAYDGGRGWGTPGTDEVPEHIDCQVMAQCSVLGARRGHVARMKGKRVTSYTIDMPPADADTERAARWRTWLERGETFLDSVTAGVPPAIDGSDATEAVLAYQYSDLQKDAEEQISDALIERYRWALNHANAAAKTLALARNQVRAAMGNAEFAVDAQGEKVAQRRSYKRHEYTVPVSLVDGVWPVGVRR